MPRITTRGCSPQAEGYCFGGEAPPHTRADVIAALVPYAEAQLSRGVHLRAIARHVLGLYHGQPGGRRFRQILSDAGRLRDGDPRLLLEAVSAVEREAPATLDAAA